MNPGAEHADDAAQPLRSDAERNRARIVAAARQVFGRGGLNASMASVAREARVGIATLFRRFPTKEDLIAAVFADRMDAHVAAVAAALDAPDPWHGLVGFVESVCAMQAADYGFADVLTMTFPTAQALERPRREVHDGVVELIGRAKAAGRLRDDFTPEDLLLVYMANAGVVNATGEEAPDSWRRVVALMIQALEAPPAGPCPPRPGPTPPTRRRSAPARPPSPPCRRARAADVRSEPSPQHCGAIVLFQGPSYSVVAP